MTITPQSAQVGDMLPPVVFGPITRAKLALYAGASGDHNPIHIDLDFAKTAGFDDVFVHGMLSMAQLGRVATDWAGAERLCGLSSRFTAITPVAATVTCEGRVAACFEQDGIPMLRIALTATLENGPQTLRGEALIRAD